MSVRDRLNVVAVLTVAKTALLEIVRTRLSKNQAPRNSNLDLRGTLCSSGIDFGCASTVCTVSKKAFDLLVELPSSLYLSSIFLEATVSVEYW